MLVGVLFPLDLLCLPFLTHSATLGGSTRPGFEGGSNSLYKAVRKYGFRNRNKIDYQELNLNQLQLYLDTGRLVQPTDRPLTIRDLKDSGIFRGLNKPVKILGNVGSFLLFLSFVLADQYLSLSLPPRVNKHSKDRRVFPSTLKSKRSPKVPVKLLNPQEERMYISMPCLPVPHHTQTHSPSPPPV